MGTIKHIHDLAIASSGFFQRLGTNKSRTIKPSALLLIIRLIQYVQHYLSLEQKPFHRTQISLEGQIVETNPLQPTLQKPALKYLELEINLGRKTILIMNVR